MGGEGVGATNTKSASNSGVGEVSASAARKPQAPSVAGSERQTLPSRSMHPGRGWERLTMH